MKTIPWHSLKSLSFNVSWLLDTISMPGNQVVKVLILAAP